MHPTQDRKRRSIIAGEKLRGAEKLARIPVKVDNTAAVARKPDWIRVRLPSGGKIKRLQGVLRAQGLHTVCEEAACPNLPECFGNETATFMIMGDICTRRCPFCDVAHGRPLPLDDTEPARLAVTIQHMGLRYVVITSVDRDDLRDGGASHFTACIRRIRQLAPPPTIEILVPDFRGRVSVALETLASAPPDVFNHNLETVPRLYRQVRPGADYQWSLDLIRGFKHRHPDLPAKSGLMLGLGETLAEVKTVLQDLYRHRCEMVTLGQYLQPSRHHLPVARFVHPDEFAELREQAYAIGFTRVAAGPMVRSSYHADLQAAGEFGEPTAAPA